MRDLLPLFAGHSNEPPFRILLVDDNPVDRRLYRRLLERDMGAPVIVHEAGSGREGLKVYAQEDVECIVLDYNMPDLNGIQFLVELTTAKDEVPIPVIMLSGEGNELIAIQAMMQGTIDYLVKDLQDAPLLTYTVRNTVRQHRLTLSLKQSAFHLRKMIENNVDAMLILDLDEMVRFANPAALALFNTSESQLINRPFPLHLPTTLHEAIEVTLDADQSNPKIVELELSNTLWDEDRAYLASLRDVTHHKEVERKLREINASKDKFFSIISHDLRDSFGTLLTASALMEETFNSAEPDIEELRALFGLMTQSINTTYKLLDNLLEWARFQTDRVNFDIQPIILRDLVSEAVTLTKNDADRKQIQLNNNVAPNTLLEADQNMLRFILRNLIFNALKFTSAGGSITVTATPHTNKSYLIAVRDTGVGISPDNARKLFRIDTHHSTKGTANESGTGLGLILCKEFVEKHGGHIWLDSEVGVGTTIYFTI